MLGSLFAGTEESPGRDRALPGPLVQVLSRHGLARRDAAGLAPTAISRTPKTNADKLVPEGIEGRVPYKGRVAAVIQQLMGGVRASMGYYGCATIDELRTRTPSSSRSPRAGMRESHVHDVQIVKEAPNYRVE